MGKLLSNAFRACAGTIACVSVPIYDSSAQSYPAKPIRVVVGFAAGGGADLVARMIGQKLAENLGQPVVVENRTGAGSSIANEKVATSLPDGYTLLVISASATILPALNAKLSYSLERDLTPVSFVASGPLVLVVHPSVPAHNIKELIALARSRPGKLNYGSAGVGSTGDLGGALFALMAKVNMTHVPYKGSSESAIATAGGQVDMIITSIPPALPLLEVGKLRALAVTTAKRTSLMPSMPTIDESGLPAYDRSSWNGMLAPTGVPKDIIARLNSAIGKAVSIPEIKDAFKKQGLEPQASTPEQFAAIIHNEIALNAKLIKLTGTNAELSLP